MKPRRFKTHHIICLTLSCTAASGTRSVVFTADVIAALHSTNWTMTKAYWKGKPKVFQCKRNRIFLNGRVSWSHTKRAFALNPINTKLNAERSTNKQQLQQRSKAQNTTTNTISTFQAAQTADIFHPRIKHFILKSVCVPLFLNIWKWVSVKKNGCKHFFLQNALNENGNLKHILIVWCPIYCGGVFVPNMMEDTLHCEDRPHCGEHWTCPPCPCKEFLWNFYKTCVN